MVTKLLTILQESFPEELMDKEMLEAAKDLDCLSGDFTLDDIQGILSQYDLPTATVPVLNRLAYEISRG